jgi:hypothetical protein
MGRIISFGGDPHEEIQKLFPWYVTGRLDACDQASVEAHLAGCVPCREELKLDRLLRVEAPAIPLDVDAGWAAFRRRMVTSPKPAGGAWNRFLPRVMKTKAAKIGSLLAAQAAVAVFAVLAFSPDFRPQPYHTLGAPVARAPGNIIVVFRPDTNERDLRRTLRYSGARLVDGPTSANAYVLNVSGSARPAALAKLRAQANVVLAEPIDGAAAP